jgi:hypothetical protein
VFELLGYYRLKKRVHQLPEHHVQAMESGQDNTHVCTNQSQAFRLQNQGDELGDK